MDVVTAADGKRELVTMRWELLPWWWSKSLKQLKMATFNARAETIETKQRGWRRNSEASSK